MQLWHQSRDQTDKQNKHKRCSVSQDEQSLVDQKHYIVFKMAPFSCYKLKFQKMTYSTVSSAGDVVRCSRGWLFNALFFFHSVCLSLEVPIALLLSCMFNRDDSACACHAQVTFIKSFMTGRHSEIAAVSELPERSIPNSVVIVETFSQIVGRHFEFPGNGCKQFLQRFKSRRRHTYRGVQCSNILRTDSSHSTRLESAKSVGTWQTKLRFNRVSTIAYRMKRFNVIGLTTGLRRAAAINGQLNTDAV